MVFNSKQNTLSSQPVRLFVFPRIDIGTAHVNGVSAQPKTPLNRPKSHNPISGKRTGAPMQEGKVVKLGGQPATKDYRTTSNQIHGRHKILHTPIRTLGDDCLVEFSASTLLKYRCRKQHPKTTKIDCFVKFIDVGICKPCSGPPLSSLHYLKKVVAFMGIGIKKIKERQKNKNRVKKIKSESKKYSLKGLFCCSPGLVVCGSSGNVVPWSFGPLVLWSTGPLVPWSLGPLVHWSPSPPVSWSSGPVVRWPGPLVFCSPTALVCRSPGPLLAQIED